MIAPQCFRLEGELVRLALGGALRAVAQVQRPADESELVRRYPALSHADSELVCRRLDGGGPPNLGMPWGLVAGVAL